MEHRTSGMAGFASSLLSCCPGRPFLHRRDRAKQSQSRDCGLNDGRTPVRNKANSLGPKPISGSQREAGGEGSGCVKQSQSAGDGRQPGGNGQLYQTKPNLGGMGHLGKSERHVGSDAVGE
jgi:hypothetical protein